MLRLKFNCVVEIASMGQARCRQRFQAPFRQISEFSQHLMQGRRRQIVLRSVQGSLSPRWPKIAISH